MTTRLGSNTAHYAENDHGYRLPQFRTGCICGNLCIGERLYLFLSIYHLITDTVLNGKQGIATIKGNKLASVIATAMQYGRNETLGINTVYGIQASEPLGTVMRGSYNTFLKQGCHLLMANPTSTEVIATVAMKRYDGTNVELGRMLAVPAHGLTNYDLCAEDEANVYGVVTVQPQHPNTIFATVLRIGENEQYRFSTPVRE